MKKRLSQRRRGACLSQVNFQDHNRPRTCPPRKIVPWNFSRLAGLPPPNPFLYSSLVPTYRRLSPKIKPKSSHNRSSNQPATSNIPTDTMSSHASSTPSLSIYTPSSTPTPTERSPSPPLVEASDPPDPELEVISTLTFCEVDGQPGVELRIKAPGSKVTTTTIRTVLPPTSPKLQESSATESVEAVPRHPAPCDIAPCEADNNDIPTSEVDNVEIHHRWPGSWTFPEEEEDKGEEEEVGTAKEENNTADTEALEAQRRKEREDEELDGRMSYILLALYVGWILGTFFPLAICRTLDKVASFRQR